jgi:hypothetical protein
MLTSTRYRGVRKTLFLWFLQINLTLLVHSRK